mmetsp:Transcript_22224/g.16649  ORF Transcript_22224/g.16649 Transcript_22224/m.16649 type:complete len:93 (+) Transcript_22224:817-1095(+)
MHHRLHDEPEWHLEQDNEERDDLDSVLSENYRQMERKFKEGVVGAMNSGSRRKQFSDEEDSKLNIFNGNLYQYKDKKEKERQANSKNLDFTK